MTRYMYSHGKRIAVETLNPTAPNTQQQTDRLFGCPLKWAKRVIPIVQSKEQLAVAIWLHRRHAVCGKREWFDVPNDALHKELGLSRYVKYRTLRILKKAKAVATRHDNKRALQVKILR